MSQIVINLKPVKTAQQLGGQPKPRFGAGWWRNLLVIVISILISALGIRASDKLGGDSLNSSLAACPPEMVRVLSAKGDFCIDQFEASTGERCPKIDPSGPEDVQANIDVNECAPVSQKARLPWRFISENQAAVACARAGKRLPTNIEWQQAALGTADRQAGWLASDCNVDNNWSLPGAGLTGSAVDCKAASQAYDMSGNVWEWVSDSVVEGVANGRILPDQGYVAGLDDNGLPSQTAEAGKADYYNDYLFIKKQGLRAIARGGYWGSQEKAGVNAAYIVSEPGAHEGGVGFRCVK